MSTVSTTTSITAAASQKLLTDLISTTYTDSGMAQWLETTNKEGGELKRGQAVCLFTLEMISP